MFPTLVGEGRVKLYPNMNTLRVFTLFSVLALCSGRNFETGGQNLEADQSFEVVSGEQGEVVEIPCDLIVDPHVVIVWKQRRRILFAGSLRVRQDARLSLGEGGGLRVEGVEAADAGEYSCQAELDGGELVVNMKTLIVLQPATAKIQPAGGVITVKSGTSLVLSCTGSGTPEPELSWVREGKVLASGRGEVDLPLKTIGWQNAGLYQCQASNGVGPVHTQNFTIHVLHAPVVEVLPAEVELEPSCRLQLQCLVYSAPASNVKWFHKGRLLKAGNDVTMWSLEYLHVLQLADCTDREGEYTCTAENSLGSNEAVVTVQEHMMRVEEVVVRVDRQISVQTNSAGYLGVSLAVWVMGLMAMIL